MSFFERVRARAIAINSLLCVGLDPHTSDLESVTAASAEAYCIDIIQKTSEFAVMFKPNSAFFEAFGADGIRALENVIRAIPEDVLVLLDAKRGDISTTAAAYAVSAFEKLQAHAITLAPYMGYDSIDPFIQNKEKGCFVLCKTSNKSASDFQTLSVASTELLYECVARKCDVWNGNDNVGLVIGATDCEALTRVRAIAPKLWILAPGIGAQGGNLEEAVFAGTCQDGVGLLIPISRGIAQAKDPKAAARSFRDAINVARKDKVAHSKSVTSNSTCEPRSFAFLHMALQCGVLKFGDFKLKSGRHSPYFFNTGLFRTGNALAQLGRFYAQTIHASGVEFDVLFGPAYKGITLVASVAIAYSQLYGIDVPYVYNRKEVKDHGEGGLLVGAEIRQEKNRVLIIDDVITAGTAVKEALRMLESADAKLIGVCIALDRQEKVSATDARSAVRKVQDDLGVPVLSVARLDDLVAYLSAKNEQKSQLDQIQAYRTEFGVEGTLNKN